MAVYFCYYSTINENSLTTTGGGTIAETLNRLVFEKGLSTSKYLSGIAGQRIRVNFEDPRSQFASNEKIVGISLITLCRYPLGRISIVKKVGFFERYIESTALHEADAWYPAEEAEAVQSISSLEWAAIEGEFLIEKVEEGISASRLFAMYLQVETAIKGVKIIDNLKAESVTRNTESPLGAESKQWTTIPGMTSTGVLPGEEEGWQAIGFPEEGAYWNVKKYKNPIISFQIQGWQKLAKESTLRFWVCFEPIKRNGYCLQMIEGGSGEAGVITNFGLFRIKETSPKVYEELELLKFAALPAEHYQTFTMAATFHKLTVYHNNTLLGEVEDSTYKEGYVGMSSSKENKLGVINFAALEGNETQHFLPAQLGLKSTLRRTKEQFHAKLTPEGRLGGHIIIPTNVQDFIL